MGILLILDLINPELAGDMPRAPQLGLIEKCQRAWGWFQEFVREVGEYAGAHVLSMVRAHYPLIDLTRQEAGYLKEVDPDKANELWIAHLDLSTKIIGDINLCGSATPPVRGMPSISQLATPSTLSQPVMPAVSTSQAPAGPSSSARSAPESPRTEHEARTSEQQRPRAPTGQ